MESLFESLYAYAMENRFDLYSLRNEKEREEHEKMVRHALEELKKQGMDDAVERLEGGLFLLSCIDRRSAFWAGLSIGLELNRL